MMQSKKAFLEKKLRFRKIALDNAYKAYNTILDGGVTEYMIGDRQATKLDLPKLWNLIEQMEAEIQGIEHELVGIRGRRAFGVVPKEW